MSEYNNSKLDNVIRKWNTQQLIETLKDNGLAECCDVIRDKQIDGDAFMKLTEGQLMLWKNRLTKLQITRLWWVIQLAHGRPEEFVRSIKEPKKPSIHKNNSNIHARVNSIQNLLENNRVQEEPQELYSNHEAARSEIQPKPKKPLPVLAVKQTFITKPNPVLSNYNKKVQGNQNKEIPTPPMSTLDYTYLSMDKATLSTAYPIRNDAAQNAFEATSLPSISVQHSPTLCKAPLQTPSPQLPSGKTALPSPSQNFRDELKATLSPSRYQKSPPSGKAPLQTPSPQLPSGKTALTVPLQNFRNELNTTLPPSRYQKSPPLGRAPLRTPSPQLPTVDDFEEDKNQSILQQMINKSPILHRISPHNKFFSTNEEISQEIPEKRQPTIPSISNYFRPVPQPPSAGGPHQFRQIPVPPMQLPGPPIHLRAPPMQLPCPPMGLVPDIELDDFDDDFDEGYEYSVISESFDYKLKPWFKNVNREAAIKLLNGQPNGAFIVRPSKYEKYECTFSISYDNRIYHLAVLKRGSAFSLGNASYNTITEIVDKYMEENFVLNGLHNENCYVKLQLVDL